MPSTFSTWTSPAAPERLYAAAPGHTLQNLYSLTAAGDRVVVMEQPEDRDAPVTCLEISVSTGKADELFTDSGPLDTPGRGWQNAGQVSDVMLVDIATGARTLLARTAADRHPRHPHPVFTPDGTAVLHNDGDPSTGEVAAVLVPLPLEDSSR